MTAWNVLSNCNDPFALGVSFEKADASAPRGLAADVHETETGYILRFDVPGVKADDIEITLESRALRLRGTRRFEQRGAPSHAGRRPEAFAASYSMPDGIEAENICAELHDGVLTLRVPKQPKAQPRRIPLQTSRELAR